MRVNKSQTGYECEFRYTVGLNVLRLYSPYNLYNEILQLSPRTVDTSFWSAKLINLSTITRTWDSTTNIKFWRSNSAGRT